jgi:hypothetical protein
MSPSMPAMVPPSVGPVQVSGATVRLSREHWPNQPGKVLHPQQVRCLPVDDYTAGPQGHNR